MKTLSLFEYNELNENRFYNKVALYIIIVLIIIFISIIVLLKIKKNVYYSNRLFISDSNIITNISIDDLAYLDIILDNIVYLKLLYPLESADTVLENCHLDQYMYIDNDLVKYSIKNIELINDIVTYYRITLSLETNKKNNIMEYKIQLQRENMLNYFISFIGG